MEREREREREREISLEAANGRSGKPTERERAHAPAGQAAGSEDGGVPRKDIVLDVALALAAHVGAPPDLEEALHPPLCGPAVGTKPVGLRLLPLALGRVHPPPDNLDGVPPLGDVDHALVVDTALVRHERAEHDEPGLDGAVGHDLLLDVLLRLELVHVRRLVLDEGLLAVDARADTLCRLALARAVREARLCDDASGLEVLPRVVEEAAAAPVVRLVA
mmetsp:Transcript_10060/g.26039  ORF Transcript_10060/g.26039 Transcript_10060/m.26039 type:complete len:220 (-) Transcript_10060:436-1095(-)